MAEQDKMAALTGRPLPAAVARVTLFHQDGSTLECAPVDVSELTAAGQPYSRTPPAPVAAQVEKVEAATEAKPAGKKADK